MEFPKAFLSDMQHILNVEGGWADRRVKDDPGGPTFYGITLRTYNRYLKRHDKDPVTKKKMRETFTKDIAYRIYYQLYWAKIGAASLPAGIRLLLFDIHVLEGVRGLKRVQAELGVRQDGVIGPKTRKAIEDQSGDNLVLGEMLIDRLATARLNYLKTRTHWAANAKGWANRVSYMKARAADGLKPRLPRPLGGQVVHNPNPEPWEDPGEGMEVLTRGKGLDGTTGIVEEQETDMISTKSIFQSKGVWGGVIALLATVLSIFNINIAPEDVTILTASVEQIIALVGTLWAIYGRVVAKDTLTV